MDSGLVRWFPTVILEKHLTEFYPYNSHLMDRAYDLRQRYPQNSTAWKCDTYNTLHNWPWEDDLDSVLRNLILYCCRETHAFSRTFGVDKPIDKFRCTDFWFNIAGPGAYQEFHQHANNHFSLVYYVKTPQRCGNIIFQNPSAVTDMFSLPISEITANSRMSCSYQPHEGSMLLFRSNLLHMVEKNLSDEDRISISMNFRIDF